MDSSKTAQETSVAANASTVCHSPPTTVQVLRAFTSLKPTFIEYLRLPSTYFKATLSTDKKQLQNYCDLFGIKLSNTLPMVFPQILATPLMYQLLLNKDFPIKVLGVVHLSHKIQQFKPLNADQSYDGQCFITETKRTRRGYEFNLQIEILNKGNLCWQSNAIFLSRDPKAKRQKSKSDEANEEIENLSFTNHEDWFLTKDLGRKYAKVSYDYNPIHLWQWSSRLFGFNQPIVHGLWTVSKLASTLGLNGIERAILAVDFCAPIFLPSPVTLRSTKISIDQQFAIYAHSSDRLLVRGRVER